MILVFKAEKFQQIKDAYEILSDDILKENYEKFLRNKQYHINKKNEQNAERNKYATNLLQKEEEYNKKKEEEAQDKLKKFFARREEVLIDFFFVNSLFYK